MTEKKGFVISWFYPPVNSSEGLVTYKLLKNSSLNYDVWTRAHGDQEDIWDRKTDESSLTAKNVTPILCDEEDIDKWVDRAVEYFDQHADEYDFIMSRIMPQECHIAAARIKEKHPEIKWIASFGDPLVDTPYIPYVERSENPFHLSAYYEREPMTRLKALRIGISPTRFANLFAWEKQRQDRNRAAVVCQAINRRTFENADILLFNNQYQYDRAFSRPETMAYKDKGRIIWHSFDSALYPAKSVSKKDTEEPLHFVYVGHLDDKRRAKSLFEALGQLKQHDEALSQKAVFDFYGHMDRDDMAEIINSDVADIVKVHPDVDYLTSLEKIAEADWVVLIDTNLNSELKEYIYFPAKLVDYFGAKKPVFAITQLKGASADVIRELQAGQIVTHSANDIALYLAKIIYQQYNPAKYDSKVLKKYDARQMAQEFDKIVASETNQTERKKKF